MQAIILAAGMGKRLKELTRNNTKCMVKVNGVTLIDRMLHQIENKHLSRIVIVIGYEGQKLIDYIQTLDIKIPIIYINNPIYDKTNNIYSLALAKDWLCKEDTLLFESDIIFEDAVLEDLLNDPQDTLSLVDKYESWMDGTCLKLFDDDTIEAFISKKNFKFDEIKNYYKTVNIYKFSKSFSETYYVPFLEAYQKALGENDYYEQVLRVITMLDNPNIKAKRLSGRRWYEIDDIQDLDIAESIFASEDKIRVNLIQKRDGGYWRYPKMLDFSSIVNPYFPPEQMRDELRANFDTLITASPSRNQVLNLLAGKNFSVHEENIVVCNGTDILFRELVNILGGTTGFVNTEQEALLYSGQEDNSVSFKTGLLYNADEIINLFENKTIHNLAIMNPDKTTGSYLCKKEMKRLLDWTESKGINLIIDESLTDFADKENISNVEQKTINEHPGLYIMKNVSDSYGIPGIRIGILASGNVPVISSVKNRIQNIKIDSVAEFFMQISEKYNKDYSFSLRKIKEEKQRVEELLNSIDGIQVISSVFTIITPTAVYSAEELMEKLLINHNILTKVVKNNTDETPYIRICIRDKKDNDILINALKFELNSL